MRRIVPVVVLCVAAAAFSASAAVAKPKPKAPTIKTGTYKAKAGTVAFNITLVKAKCTTAPGVGTPATHLCVSLPTAPQIQCKGPVTGAGAVGPFKTPIALSALGKATEKTPANEATTPNGIKTSEQSAFSVTFTKKGTAIGSLEVNLTEAFGDTSIPCVSGPVAFTAKLG